MISLLQLKYFCTLAKNLNLTRTAEQLYVSQSTLSASISRLEKEVGVPLFDRKGGRIFLNENGKVYLEHIETALSEIELAAELAKKEAQSREKEIRIAASHSRIWLDMSVQFMREHPDVRLAFKTENLATYYQRLMDGRLDFVITGAGDLDSPDLDSREIAVWPVCLRVPPGHPYVERFPEGIHLNEIGNEPYIDIAEGVSFRMYCDRILEAAGVRVNRVYECESAARPDLIRSGQGVCIAVDHFTTGRFFYDCPRIPILDPGTDRHVLVFWKRGRRFTSTMELFLEYLQGYLRRNEEESHSGS